MPHAEHSLPSGDVETKPRKYKRVRAVGEKLALEILPREIRSHGGIWTYPDKSGFGQKALARCRVVSVGKDVKRAVKVGDVVLVREYMGFEVEGLLIVWEKDVLAVEG